MTHQELLDQLDGELREHRAHKHEIGDEFEAHQRALTEAWTAANVSLELALDVVLAFMELHPQAGFGSPGSLVHFVEPLCKQDSATYIAKLVASIARRPTSHTLWMLNRVINELAKTNQELRISELIAVMEQARRHPGADPLAVEEATEFVEWLRETYPPKG